jgi:protein-disulfide isomerase
MKRFVKITLILGLLSLGTASYAESAALAQNNVTVGPVERAKIEQVVHQYLLNKPEVLVEALQVLQKKQLEQAQETVKKTQQIAGTFGDALFHQPNDPIGGNPDGKVTVVEFFDYQCPHCVDMAPVITAIVKNNPDVRVIFKEFPIRGPLSDFAARAALAANKQGKYIEFSHALLSQNKDLTNDLILQVAKNSGLDVDKLKKDMEDKSIKDQINANSKLAQDLKLFGTPAIFVGKTLKGSPITYVPGQMAQPQLQELIDKARK